MIWLKSTAGTASLSMELTFSVLRMGPGISSTGCRAKLDDIRDMMRRDALPVDMEHAEPPAAEIAAMSEMIFVRQLRAVGLAGRRLENAKRDYYRAFTQRSRWARENLIFDGEVAGFEATLVEEWEPRFDQMCESLGSGPGADDLRRAVAGADKADRRDVAFTPVVEYEPAPTLGIEILPAHQSPPSRAFVPGGAHLYLLANKPGREHRSGNAAGNPISEVG